MSLKIAKLNAKRKGERRISALKKRVKIVDSNK